MKNSLHSDGNCGNCQINAVKMPIRKQPSQLTIKVPKDRVASNGLSHNPIPQRKIAPSAAPPPTSVADCQTDIYQTPKMARK